MTYRFNPFDKEDYSKFAFKKSELLEVLQAIDENFSFDSANANLQENKELLHIEANTNTNHDYKFFLYKKPLLTFHEAACIMTGYDPQYVEQCQNDTNFKQNFSEYLGAYDYINTFTDTDLLSYDNNCRLYLKEFKSFLSNENIIIDDFNDELKDSELSKKDQNAEILRLSQIITEKDIEIKKLKQDIEKEQSTSFDSWLDQVKAEKEANELQERIKKLEEDQAAEEIKENYSDLTPEQEIPNARQRNNVLKIISILSEMADLPPEPFTAFNMMDAHATQNGKEIPSKHTIADWLKRAKDSN